MRVEGLGEFGRRFDADSSGHLDQNEFKYLCAYIGACGSRSLKLPPALQRV